MSLFGNGNSILICSNLERISSISCFNSVGSSIGLSGMGWSGAMPAFLWASHSFLSSSTNSMYLSLSRRSLLISSSFNLSRSSNKSTLPSNLSFIERTRSLCSLNIQVTSPPTIARLMNELTACSISDPDQSIIFPPLFHIGVWRIIIQSQVLNKAF
ncbi:hypothetical protein ES708_29024 [subsurface metagenome]